MKVILMPAYKPDEQMIKIVGELADAGAHLLIVDDGSGENYQSIFDEVETRYPNEVRVIHASVNGGKGTALKLGMSSLLNIYPECTGFITADCDGQHKKADILAVRDALEQGSSMVITIRNFDGKIPLTSRMGNRLSRWVYTTMTGRYFKDNQSGLRGFGIEHIDWLTKVAGDRYDYELNLLYYAHKQRIKIDTLPIETIYINDNKSSHFDPLWDTLRIYRSLFRSGVGALSASLLYLFAMIVTTVRFGYTNCYFMVAGSGIVCTIVCIVIECIVFRKVRYRDADDVLLSRIVRAALYTIAALLAARFAPKIPLAVVFILAVLLVAFLRYLLNKAFTKKTTRKRTEDERIA